MHNRGSSDRLVLNGVSLSALFLALGAASPAVAQESSSASAPQDQSAPEAAATSQLNEEDGDIVVTARRREESLQNVPVAVAAIGGATLQKYAVADVAQISQLVPSMVVGRQASGSSASIFLRGVGSSSLSSGFDQSVSLNVDQLPMSRGKELITSQYDLARVEVLKGPQALFFGKNSTGGVVVLTSADPTRELEAGYKGGYEIQAREVYTEGYFGGPIAGDLLGRASFRISTSQGAFYNTAQSNTTNGFLRTVDSRRRGAAETFAGRVTLKYDNPDVVSIKLKLQGTHQTDDSASALYERLCAGGRTVPRPTAGIPEIYTDCKVDGHNGFANMSMKMAGVFPLAGSGVPYTNYDAYLASLIVDKAIGRVNLTSVTGAYGFKQRDLTSAAGSTAGLFFTQDARFRQFSQELRLLTDFDGPINLTAGGFFADTRFRFRTAAMAAILPQDPATGRYDSFDRVNGIDGRTYSAFAELKWNIIDTLELAGGARYSHEAKDSFVQNIYASPFISALFPANKGFTDRFRDNNLSPQATLTWRPTADLTLYGAYKQGFKAGGFNTSLTILTTSLKSDGEFQSETAEGYEGGIRSQFLDRQLRLNLTGYSYRYSDLQVQVYNATNSASIVANAGSLTTRGAEFEGNFRPAAVPGLEFHTSLAYNVARYHDYVGSCFTGQTVAEGCDQVPNAAGAFSSQVYGGRIAPKAPRFAGRAGASYEVPLDGDISIGISGDAGFSSRYNFTDTLRPDAIQKGFTRYDAGLRFFNKAAGWELAVIGRNLTNEYIVTSANDMPGQGAGGTGTAIGIRSDMNTLVDRPRQIYVQGSIKF